VGAIGADVVKAVAVRPGLWRTALVVVARFAAPGWWRRRPYLPLPADDLWRFRMVTAYGDPDRRPPPSDVLDYLEWCRRSASDRRSVPDTARGRTRRRGHGEDG
jgi:hypothetical protein